MNTPARVTGTPLFRRNNFAFATQRPKWHNFCLVCISTLGVGELALLEKLQESTKLQQLQMMQVYVSPFWLCFLDFIPVDQTEISHMNRQQNLSR